jgi:coenzyme PQQ biosynthesis protein C
VKVMTPDELEAALRDIGANRYHRLHPFHGLLHGGKCSKGQVQAWALNRYYYQAIIPLKDASLIGRCEDPALRREWRSRLVDHDGDDEREGGIERWLRLTDGLGLDREYVASTRGLLPGTRFAADAYVRFVRERPLLEAIASSLTELFSPAIIGERVAGMLAHYDFVTRETLAYFDKRPPLAKRDSDFALDYVRRHATTPQTQAAVMAALEFKCDVLWAMLDALYHAYVAPKHVPPGAFVPQDHAA